jgi:diguanylate cyclase (GGDEF)-like protein/PAS domain S-box-containing protein
MEPQPPAEAHRLERRLERERRCRQAAEEIAERATAQLYATVRELERFRSALEETTDFVVIADGEGHPLYINRAIAEFLGIEAAQVPTIKLADLLTPPSRARFVEAALPTLEDKGVWRGELAMIGRHGREIPVSQVLIAHRRGDGVIESVSSISRDMTEQRAFQEQLAQQARQDPLTGLANRRLLGDHLDLAIARAARAHTATAVLYVDLDYFKEVNDRLGHRAGDDVLVAVADRLRAITRPADVVARLGGDEFVIACEGLTGDPTADVTRLADRLAEGMQAPIEIEDEQVVVTASVGIAFTDGIVDPDTLLQHADEALYRAKREGRNQYRLWRGP